MNEVQQILNLKGEDLLHLFLIVIVAIAAFQFLHGKFKWFWHDFLGAETKMTRHEKEQQESIRKLDEEICGIKQEQDTMAAALVELKGLIHKIDRREIESEIDGKRWLILDFASAIVKRNYSAEAYVYIIKIYEDYERIIHENDLENGEVDIAIKFIKKKYAEYKENGFPEY